MTVETRRVELNERAGGKVLEVHLTGRLEKEDYDLFVPVFERLIEEHGKLHLLLILDDFEGWTAGALWQDLKVDFEHWDDIAKLAIVGENRWEKGMADFCKPFTSAEVKFFEKDDLDAAREWLETLT